MDSILGSIRNILHMCTINVTPVKRNVVFAEQFAYGAESSALFLNMNNK